jgi:Fic family protein
MLDEIIKKVDAKRAELDSLRPIKAENMIVIKEKLELDYNFYSNAIEGNTLTLGETNALIKMNLEATIAKRQRDIQEMKGHIDAVNDLELFKEKYNEFKLPAELNQNFIKNLHKKIFVEDEIKYSYHNGNKRTSVVKAGEYKLFANSVRQPDGNIFEYMSPHETPSAMMDLVDWYNKNRETVHPVVLGSIFHYKFIRIHPFGDGNGRMARLLLNFVLQSSGYSIVIVTTDDRKNYINNLDLTNNNFTKELEYINSEVINDFEPFVSYIANLELNYLSLMIRGAKGDELLDVDDVIKQAQFRKENLSKNAETLTLAKVLNNSEMQNLANKDYEFVLDKINQYFKAINYIDLVNPNTPEQVAINYPMLSLNFKNEKSNANVRVSIINGKIKRNIQVIFTLGIEHVSQTEEFVFEYIDIDLKTKTRDLITKIDNLIKQYDN